MSGFGLFAVGHHIDELKTKYRDHDRVAAYLEAVRQDVVKNIGDLSRRRRRRKAIRS